MDKQKPLTRLNDALAQIQNTLEPISATKKIPISKSLGRVLAQDVISDINVPAHTNSAMDGYVMRGFELQKSKNFKLAGTVYAGEVFMQNAGENECVRIMTGAPIPEGLDFVVPQEYASIDNGNIVIGDYTGGSNVRLAGEDLAIGETALHQGRKLSANDIGLLASLGLAKVTVYRKLKVAFFSTGNELKEPGKKLKPGQIYNSNRYSIKAMLQSMGAKALDLGVIRDDKDAINKAFLQAAAQADVVLTSGGVSVGEADYIKQVLEEIGHIDLWRLSIKPGKPLAFGKIDNSYFFGLPGNPVSSAIVFYKIVKPMLKILMGQKQNIYPPLLKAKLLNPINKKSNRMEFMRAKLEPGPAGPEVSVPENQGSGILSSMYKANCLVVLDEDTKDKHAGEMVDVEPFFGLL